MSSGQKLDHRVTRICYALRALFFRIIEEDSRNTFLNKFQKQILINHNFRSDFAQNLIISKVSRNHLPHNILAGPSVNLKLLVASSLHN